MRMMTTVRMSRLSLLSLLVLVGCANPADDVAPATVREVEETPASTDGSTAQDISGQAAKIYTISEDSKIEFTGSKVTGSHDGGFESFQGQLAAVDGKLVRHDEPIEIDMTSTWTDSDRLTGHLKRDDFFGVEEHPTSTFTITSVEVTDSSAMVTGNLNLHGVTKSISFPAEVSVTPEQVTLKAEFFIKRFEFEIEYPGNADDLIRDEVVIRLNIVATAGESAA